MASVNILITGATGYIGGTVLTTLLSSSHPAVKELSITALVRDKSRGKALELLEGPRVTSVPFSGLDDWEHLKRLAAEHDIVIHTASGFHTGSAQALMAGLAERKKKTGNDVHYIHTSGTWNLADAALSSNQFITFSDETDDIAAIEARLDAQEPFSQRTTDLAVIAASEETGVKTYLVMPPDVYGLGTGRSNQQASLMKDMVSEAITQGGPRHAGDGSGEVGHVHVVDLATLYETLLQSILDGKEPDSGRRGIYFCSSGSHVWGDVAKAIGEAAVEFGSLQSAESTPMDTETAARMWTGGNRKDLKRGYCARFYTKPDKANALGWRPTKTDEDWQKWIRDSVHTALRDRNSID